MKLECYPIQLENGVAKTLAYTQQVFLPTLERVFEYEAALEELAARVKLPDGKYYVAIPTKVAP